MSEWAQVFKQRVNTRLEYIGLMESSSKKVMNELANVGIPISIQSDGNFVHPTWHVMFSGSMFTVTYDELKLGTFAHRAGLVAETDFVEAWRGVLNHYI